MNIFNFNFISDFKTVKQNTGSMKQMNLSYTTKIDEFYAKLHEINLRK